MDRATVVRGREFCAPRAWGALALAAIDGASARLHWSDQPHPWRLNDGAEVFAVLDGVVDMHYRCGGRDYLITLCVGDVFCPDQGCEYLARPRGEARVLMVDYGRSRGQPMNRRRGRS